ncbi:MAG TPA: transglycosylase domain-containing protein, partial [Longimicrobiales bacterium]|nr:transglycosylase domain-containing protein [Longimicrobiales bacterium]
RLYRIDRTMVTLDSLPPYVPAAFVAVEDQRFWRHGGVDLRRVPAAIVANLMSGRIRQGSSTITMQLARNVFPDRLPYHRRSIGRKLAEMRVARLIEGKYSKEQILELYINHVYFGNGAWGIDAAARGYFGKPASDLTLGEAALLAGTVAAPRLLNPETDPRYIYGRRFVVLNLMVGAGAISVAAADSANRLPVVFSAGSLPPARIAPYFIQEVRRRLEAELGEALYTAGYVVHTTLDPAVQAVVDSELERQLSEVEAGAAGEYTHPPYVHSARSTGRETEYLQGAVVVLHAATGDVLVLAGGRDFGDSRYNRASLARRQPASTFKPFVYVAALSMGRSPASLLDDRPLERPGSGGHVWRPRNYGDRYAAAISLRDALVLSSNVASIRLAEEVGLDQVAATARRMGLSGPFPLVPSLALGTAETTLLELTAAYGAFATLGWRAAPRLITRVVDRSGDVVWQSEAAAAPVLDPAAAFLLTDVLRDAVDRGTGRAVRDAGFRGPAAGKTGTS